MPKVISTHNVEDVDNWLRYRAERAELVGTLGGRNVVDLVAQDGSQTVGLSFEVDDVDALLARMQSPSAELAEAMQRHGVLPPITTFVER